MILFGYSSHTAGKLDPKWEGGGKIVKVVSSINMQIQDGKRTQVVHVNHLQEGVQNENYPPYMDTTIT